MLIILTSRKGCEVDRIAAARAIIVNIVEITAITKPTLKDRLDELRCSNLSLDLSLDILFLRNGRRSSVSCVSSSSYSEYG